MKKGRKLTQFGTKTPLYAPSAYLGFFQLENDEYSLWYPYDMVLPRMEHLFDEALQFEKKLASPLRMSDIMIIVPLTLRTLYPLEKRYWNKPNIHYSQTDRIHLFQSMLTYPSIYEVVITPAKQKRKSVSMAAIPLLLTSASEQLEQFMMNSDYPVDHTASRGAIYTPHAPYTVNWKTKERIDSYHTAGAKILH